MSIEMKNFKLSVYYPDTQYPNGGVWITRTSGDAEGESMAVRMEEFEALVSEYFEENM